LTDNPFSHRLINKGKIFPLHIERSYHGLFDKILEKLGLGRSAQAGPVPVPKPEHVPSGPARSVSSMSWRNWRNSRLEPQKLNWKVSIVDLLKLLV